MPSLVSAVALFLVKSLVAIVFGVVLLWGQALGLARPLACEPAPKTKCCCSPCASQKCCAVSTPTSTLPDSVPLSSRGLTNPDSLVLPALLQLFGAPAAFVANGCDASPYEVICSQVPLFQRNCVLLI